MISGVISICMATMRDLYTEVCINRALSSVYPRVDNILSHGMIKKISRLTYL